MSEELKPCPICGGEAKPHLYVDDDGQPEHYAISCWKGAHQVTVGSKHKERAIAAWNTRAATARIAKLEAALWDARGVCALLAQTLRNAPNPSPEYVWSLLGRSAKTAMEKADPLLNETLARAALARET